MESEILRTSVREKIITLVLSGELKPGERIKELSLSRKLNVSRTPLREALISLQRAGLVRSEPNIGFTVKEMSAKELEEIYPLLILLESHAMMLAFPLLQTQVNELEAINERLNGHSTTVASIADHEFHLKLTRLCRNETLLQIISELRLRMSCYDHHYMTNKELLQRSYQQHQDIISAIKEGNETKARKALIINWEYGMRLLIAELTQKELCKNTILNL